MTSKKMALADQTSYVVGSQVELHNEHSLWPLCIIPLNGKVNEAIHKPLTVISDVCGHCLTWYLFGLFYETESHYNYSSLI